MFIELYGAGEQGLREFDGKFEDSRIILQCPEA